MELWKRRAIVWFVLSITYASGGVLWGAVATGIFDLNNGEWIHAAVFGLFWTAGLAFYEESVVFIANPGRMQEITDLILDKGFIVHHRSSSKVTFMKKMGPILWWKASVTHLHGYLEVDIPKFFEKSLGSRIGHIDTSADLTPEKPGIN